MPFGADYSLTLYIYEWELGSTGETFHKVIIVIVLKERKWGLLPFSNTELSNAFLCTNVLCKLQRETCSVYYPSCSRFFFFNFQQDISHFDKLTYNMQIAQIHTLCSKTANTILIENGSSSHHTRLHLWEDCLAERGVWSESVLFA